MKLKLSISGISLLYAAFFAIAPFSSSAQSADRILDEMYGHEISYLKGDTIIRAQIRSDHRGIRKARYRRIYHYYQSGMIMHSHGGYYGILLHGDYIQLEAGSKKLIEQGYMKRGLKEGKWLAWHPNARLKSIKIYRYGRESGRFKEFHLQGTIKEKGKYHRGIKCRLAKTYSVNGIKCVAWYKKGKIIREADNLWKLIRKK